MNSSVGVKVTAVSALLCPSLLGELVSLSERPASVPIPAKEVNVFTGGCSWNPGCPENDLKEQVVRCSPCETALRKKAASPTSRISPGLRATSVLSRPLHRVTLLFLSAGAPRTHAFRCLGPSARLGGVGIAPGPVPVSVPPTRHQGGVRGTCSLVGASRTRESGWVLIS